MMENDEYFSDYQEPTQQIDARLKKIEMRLKALEELETGDNTMAYELDKLQKKVENHLIRREYCPHHLGA